MRVPVTLGCGDYDRTAARGSRDLTWRTRVPATRPVCGRCCA